MLTYEVEAEVFEEGAALEGLAHVTHTQHHVAKTGPRGDHDLACQRHGST